MAGVRHAALIALLAAVGCKKPVEPVVADPEVRDVLYFVFLDRFANGSPDTEPVDPSDPQAWHGGDLQGVIDHLDDLQDLGVAGVWLSPITKARTHKIDEWGAFHGYWVEDLAAIEPRFGTMEQAKQLRSELTDRGMSLWLDMVYNHVGYDTPLVTDKPDWFHGKGDVVDWNDPVQVVTHDVHGLPDLAQENEEVYQHLLSASKRWLELEPDGFRIDAVRHLPEGFLARLGDDLRAIDPDFQLLGEVFEGNTAALDARQEADKLDKVFDFPLHYAIKDTFCEGAHTGRIAATLSLDAEGERVTFLDNHDVSRIFSACEREAAIGALAFLLASRGTPCLTYGTEIGLQGAEEPANRADMQFGADPELRATLEELLGIRARWPSLRDGITRIEQATGERLVVRRITATETAWVIVNLSDKTMPAPSADESWGVVDTEVLPGTVALLRKRGTFDLSARDAIRHPVPAPGPDTVLVGAGPALGDWDPSRGIEAVDGQFLVELTPGKVVEYKFVTRKDDGTVAWEDGPNHYLHAGL